MVIYNKVIYLVSQKSGSAGVFSHCYAKIKVDSHDFLPIEKTMTLNDVIILIKSTFNKDQNHY